MTHREPVALFAAVAAVVGLALQWLLPDATIPNEVVVLLVAGIAVAARRYVIPAAKLDDVVVLEAARRAVQARRGGKGGLAGLILIALLVGAGCAGDRAAPAPAPEPAPAAPASEPPPAPTLQDALRGAAGGLLRAGAEEAAQRVERRGPRCDLETPGTPAEFGSLETWRADRLEAARELLQGCIAAGRFEFADTLASVANELRRRESR